MRRLIGPILFGLGAFLLVTGVLLKFYAYPRVAVAPIDQNSVTRLEATDAEVFDTSTLKPLQTDLTVQSRTVGDVKASEERGNNVRVWVNTTSVRSSDGVVRSRNTERVAFDATTAEAVNCCGAFNEVTQGERVEVKRDGLVYKFPFDTQKKKYQLWDATLGDTIIATYEGESSKEGLTVYTFVAEVPRTQVGTRDVPASVMGEKGSGNVTAESMYTATKTYLVEPVTGAIVDQSVDQTSTLALDGEDVITTTSADLRYTGPTVKANIDEFSDKASLLTLVNTTGPLIGVGLGLVLMIVGGFLARRRSA